MGQERHPLSPRLAACPEGLPREAYLDAAWFGREMATLFARQWVMAGRLADVLPGRMRRVQVGAAPVIVVRAADGGVSAFHNSCPHRGSELCRTAEEPVGKLIRCPYHAFAFSASDGALVATGHAVPTTDFDRAAHGLKPVACRVWNGFLFLNLAAAPGGLFADVGLDTLGNWPMAGLVTGHHWETEIACNWKTFWENYSECLHCPGIHPELCDMVPVYGRGIMGPSEALGWAPGAPQAPNLRAGAKSWTLDGEPCGPEFPNLSEAERLAGYSFVTLWPSTYVVAHVDYVRSVRIEPLAPERTRLVAEWHFTPETMAQPGFDAARVAAFAKIVMEQDGEASEMNQRGMRSPAFRAARLMPEEYEIHRFHRWVLNEMETHA
ncbi:aromatic ring-hydroxylating dioxygenase subunit alpha [Aestuariivirga litoralis]|uniref:Aromatic ring-hydroxylating dioxygenase subunit alpha n=1 Tax=Aestuariivirga litoralis TaxID=2650924 RepID=A0A2W2BBI5_9HYPH|nr:aromatic ring-hydroxylating dioxygenase subunit alpha [Aestuariivirga litoralis]PZF77508.1 aromatic ring-hydroxylating dioxygenase subunit alpha [Aestuariivirga litoralis]